MAENAAFPVADLKTQVSEDWVVFFLSSKPSARNGILAAGDKRAESALETTSYRQRPKGSRKKSQEMAANAAFPLSDVKPQVSEDCVVADVVERN